MQTLPNCRICGKFCIPVERELLYSGYPPEPWKEVYTCRKCSSPIGETADTAALEAAAQKALRFKSSIGHQTRSRV